MIAVAQKRRLAFRFEDGAKEANEDACPVRYVCTLTRFRKRSLRRPWHIWSRATSKFVACTYDQPFKNTQEQARLTEFDEQRRPGFVLIHRKRHDTRQVVIVVRDFFLDDLDQNCALETSNDDAPLKSKRARNQRMERLVSEHRTGSRPSFKRVHCQQGSVVHLILLLTS